jgi:hypothetical protein
MINVGGKVNCSKNESKQEGMACKPMEFLGVGQPRIRWENNLCGFLCD